MVADDPRFPPPRDCRPLRAGSVVNPKDAVAGAKAPLHLIPNGPLVLVAQALQDGASKYGAFNWRAPGMRINSSVYTGAAKRHVGQYEDGEDLDPSSECDHIAHAIAGLLILLDAKINGALVDDRPPPGGMSIMLGQYRLPKSARPPATRRGPGPPPAGFKG